MTAPVLHVPATLQEAETAMSLSLTPVSDRIAALTAQPAATWTAEDLHFYITEEIGRIHGPQLPAGLTQVIIREFSERFGIEDAVRIARAAFEVYSGMWRGAPVTVKRFLPGHDGFFSQPLLTSCS